MTLVSVDPESLRFVPVAGGENVICSADTIYPWKMVAAGVSETADFILWGYNGVDTYRLGETEFTRVQENWEMPCGTEGTCAVLVPDGRILYIGASDGFQGTTADGVEISGKDPEKTVLYYEPLVKESDNKLATPGKRCRQFYSSRLLSFHLLNCAFTVVML